VKQLTGRHMKFLLDEYLNVAQRR